jgi:hypothetical protein
MKVFRLCWQGCFSLPGYGPHSGTLILIGLIILGALTRAQDGVEKSLIGATIMALFFGPIYSIGSYDRAKSYYKQLKEDKK